MLFRNAGTFKSFPFMYDIGISSNVTFLTKLACVNAFMGDTMLFLNKTFLTMFALVQFFPNVDPFMCNIVLFGGKGFFAIATLVFLLLPTTTGQFLSTNIWGFSNLHITRLVSGPTFPLIWFHVQSGFDLKNRWDFLIVWGLVVMFLKHNGAFWVSFKC